MKRKNTLLAGLVASALLAMPMYADAAGMGRIKVNSALGQPFRAEIELTSVAKDDIDLITARLATPEQYRDAKLERPDGLAGLRFSVDKRPNGEVYLRVTSSQAINEPFLNLLIQLDWPSGRLLREYTVLLDPPGFQEAAVAPAVAPPQVAPAPKVEAPATSAPKPAPAPKVAAPAKPTPTPKPAPVVKAEPPAPAPALTPAEQTFPRFDGDRELPPLAQTLPAAPVAPAKSEPAQYTTKPGDTLSKIAREMAPEGVSLERMMVALYQSNRAAFAGDNMNRLKSGQLLKVPDASAMAGVSQQDAVREIRAQTADWNAYRQRLAGAVAEAPAAEAPAQQVAAGTITAKAEDKAPAPAEAGKDVLKLSKADAGTGGKGTSAAGDKGLQDRLSAAQEEAAAKAKALAEANARIAELEKNVKDMQALMELKNKQLADLERQAKAAPPAAAPAPEPKPAPTPAAVPEAAPAPAAEAAAPAPEPLVKAIPDEKPAEPAAAAKPAPKPEPKAKATPAPVAEESFLDTVLGNPLYLGGGAAVLVGGLFAGLWALGRRRKKSLASFEDSIMTGGGDLKANTVFGNTAGGQIDTGDTSFLTDFSQAGMGAIDTNDVDPIAEAEVYMAYGRDAQAEEILKEALNKDPHRHEIHLKLLEIYAGRKNATAFETLASELYAATGGQGPVWEKAAELGRGIDAANPLYAPPSGKGESASAAGGTTASGAAAAVAGTAAAVAAGAAAANADLDFNLDIDTRPGEAPTEAPVPDLGAALDFNLDTEPPTVASVQEAADSGALDFDIDTIIPQAVEKLAEAPAAPAEAPSLEFEPPALDTPTLAQAPKAEEDTLALDFDFNLEPSTPAAAAAAEPVTEPMMPELDLSGIDLNLGAASDAEIPTLDEATTVVSDNTVWEEASTKLDLARAYMEMGDRDGAREILQEVVSEGGPEQQEDAKKLLETLS